MNYLVYQLKVAGILFLFYTIYMLFIRRSSLFAYRRVFLLTSVVFSFILPFIHINIHSEQLPVFYQNLPEVIVEGVVLNTSNEFSFEFLIPFLAMAGTSIYLSLFMHRVISIISLINMSYVIRRQNYNIVETRGAEAFTFLKYIFLGKLISEENSGIILSHESVHADKYHSIDNLVIEVVIMIQWFNPFAWLLRREIRENHEFEADAVLLENGVSYSEYQQLLLNQMFHTRGVKFSSFNYNSFIKNRIKMMTTIPRAGKTRFLLATIMSLLVVSAFAFKLEERIERSYPVSIKSGVSLSKDSLKKVRNEVMLLPEKSATFKGGNIAAFSEYIAKNVKYPSTVEQNKIVGKGKVYVQFNVDPDGKVTDVKVLRGISPSLDNEAIRVVKSSPAWTPAYDKGAYVKQSFTLPILFKKQ